MTSRERVLAASRGEPTDRVPVLVYTFLMDRRRPAPWPWRTREEKAEVMLGLGADDTIAVHTPHGASRTAQYRVRKETVAGEPYPLLTGEYLTPHGTLRQTVRMTEDWPHGEYVPLLDDHGVSRATKWWVSEEADLAPLADLLRGPDDDEMAQFRERARDARALADRYGLVLEGGLTQVGDTAAWLMDFENLVVAALERPDFLHALFEIIWRWNLRNLELLLDSGVDIIQHRGWYESADIWSPALYRTFLAPRLAEEARLVHQAGKLHGCIMTTGLMPLLSDLKETGIDLIWGVDPRQGGADLPRVAQELRGRVAVWGGVNGAITVARGTPAETDAAVAEACDAFRDGGFVLFPVDAVFEDCPWENVLTFLKAARRHGAR